MTILHLDLPPLSEELEEEILLIAETIEPVAGVTWFEGSCDNNIRGSSTSYGRHPPLPDPIYKELNNIYGKYFNEKFIPIIGKAENVYKEGTVAHLPHCDKLRRSGINYLITNGGDNVLTCFYNSFRKNPDLTFSENCKYKDVTLESKIKFQEHTWNAFNVQQFHSVENIETIRITLHLLLDSNPDFATFADRYKHIIKKV